MLSAANILPQKKQDLFFVLINREVRFVCRTYVFFVAFDLT